MGLITYKDAFLSDIYSLEDFDLMWEYVERKTVLDTWSYIRNKDSNGR